MLACSGWLLGIKVQLAYTVSEQSNEPFIHIESFSYVAQAELKLMILLHWPPWVETAGTYHHT